MKCVKVGLCSLHFALGPGDLLLRLTYTRIRTLDLCREFGYIEGGKHLTRSDFVANVDTDVADVSGDFRVQLYLLKRQELSCDSQGICKRCASRNRDGGNGLRGNLIIVVFRVAAANVEQENERKEA